MKSPALPLFLLCFCLPVLIFAQEKSVTPSTLRPLSGRERGEVRAVVVGISDYQDPGIPDLRFAHRDAEAFAQWLSKSLAGNGLDNSHITMLLNEQASAGRVAEALDALIEQSVEGDRVFIYFSGHGDVERKTISQPGFLLCWDAPARVYMGGGTYSLAYLEEIVSTLSVQNKAKVVLITDACHAGKLAGSQIGGAQLTATSLAQQHDNEIRILSCQPSEFSLEGVQWGGGRGVFSYHLLDGLYGLADRNADQSVNLAEVIRYLEDRVPAEAAPQSQIPLVLGNRYETLIRVDTLLLSDVQQRKTIQVAAFAPVESKGLEDDILAKADSVDRALYAAFKRAVLDRRFFQPAGYCAEDYYKSLLQKQSLAPLFGAMKRNYAAALQDDAQQVLNSFLKTDMSEITRSRRKKIGKYRPYPALLDRAAQLLGPGHYFFPELMARKNIFEGFLLQLQSSRLNDRQAGNNILQFYREALRWQPDNPLTFHFMARVHSNFKADLDSAEAYILQAAEHAPGWVLPMGEFAIDLTARFNQPERAQQWLDRAIALDSGSVYLHNQYAVWYSRNRRFAEADSMFRIVVQNDSTNIWYLNNFGNNCMQMGNFQESEAAFLKTIRLDTTYGGPYISLGNLYVRMRKYENAEQWYKKSIEVDSFCALCFSGLGILYANTGRGDEALQPLRKAIEIDSTNIWAWGTIGNMFLQKKDYPAAIDAYRGVLRLDSITPNATYAFSGTGTALERSGKLDESIGAFRSAIKLDSTNFWAMCGWARALLKKGESAEAEALLNRTKATQPSDWVNYHFALLYAQTGRHDLCFEQLDAVVKKIAELDYNELQSEILLQPLHQLPEWKAFLKKHFPEQAPK